MQPLTGMIISKAGNLYIAVTLFIVMTWPFPKGDRYVQLDTKKCTVLLATGIQRRIIRNKKPLVIDLDFFLLFYV